MFIEVIKNKYRVKLGGYIMFIEVIKNKFLLFASCIFLFGNAFGMHNQTSNSSINKSIFTGISPSDSSTFNGPAGKKTFDCYVKELGELKNQLTSGVSPDRQDLQQVGQHLHRLLVDAQKQADAKQVHISNRFKATTKKRIGSLYIKIRNICEKFFGYQKVTGSCNGSKWGDTGSGYTPKKQVSNNQDTTNKRSRETYESDNNQTSSQETQVTEEVIKEGDGSEQINPPIKKKKVILSIMGGNQNKENSNNIEETSPVSQPGWMKFLGNKKYWCWSIVAITAGITAYYMTQDVTGSDYVIYVKKGLRFGGEAASYVVQKVVGGSLVAYEGSKHAIGYILNKGVDSGQALCEIFTSQLKSLQEEVGTMEKASGLTKLAVDGIKNKVNFLKDHMAEASCPSKDQLLKGVDDLVMRSSKLVYLQKPRTLIGQFISGVGYYGRKLLPGTWRGN